MSAIPSSAMPHAFAEEGVDLRDPNGGAVTEEETRTGLSTGLLIGGAAALLFIAYRALR
jgi:hypothetical protein